MFFGDVTNNIVYLYSGRWLIANLYNICKGEKSINITAHAYVLLQHLNTYTSGYSVLSPLRDSLIYNQHYFLNSLFT